MDLVIELVFAWDIDSVIYKIKHSGKDKAIKMVSRYLDTRSATETVEEFEEVISKPHIKIKKVELTGPKKLSACAEFMLYSKELKVSIIMGFLITMPFYRVLYAYNLIIMTSDIDDEDELRISRIFALFCIFSQIATQAITSFVEVNKSRKRRIVAGFLLTAVTWVCVLISFCTEV